MLAHHLKAYFAASHAVMLFAYWEFAHLYILQSVFLLITCTCTFVLVACAVKFKCKS